MDSSRQQACVVFRQLTVNNIENASGIFIGTNRAAAWSSFEKSNQGFGNVQDTAIKGVVNVLYDTDVLDATFQDASYAALTESSKQAQQCAIEFGSIHANSLNNGSAIDLGDNKQLGWRTARKNNYGEGKNLGANQLSKMVNYTMDNDALDAVFQTKGRWIDTSRVVKNVRIAQRKDHSQP